MAGSDFTYAFGRGVGALLASLADRDERKEAREEISKIKRDEHLKLRFADTVLGIAEEELTHGPSAARNQLSAMFATPDASNPDVGK
jgi:hypothetical protein